MDLAIHPALFLLTCLRPLRWLRWLVVTSLPGRASGWVFWSHLRVWRQTLDTFSEDTVFRCCSFTCWALLQLQLLKELGKNFNRIGMSQHVSKTFPQCKFPGIMHGLCLAYNKQVSKKNPPVRIPLWNWIKAVVTTCRHVALLFLVPDVLILWMALWSMKTIK